MKRGVRTWRMLLCAAFFILHSSFFISCTKEETEPGEFDNWQQQNADYLNYVVDCWKSNTPPQFAGSGKGWKRLKTYSKDSNTEGAATDYVYAYVIEEGVGTESPAYTDSVRVMYRGRLIPSPNYPEGYIFDSTVNGTFSTATGYSIKMLLSGTVEGFCTALQHMHKGDHWRVYIPSELGYGENGSTTNSNGTQAVPGYSMIVFELMLIDFSHAGQTMPAWSARTL